jgi:3-phenylpropionate/trans-cinnamate dioxygenase ferredoxin reductase subunit
LSAIRIASGEEIAADLAIVAIGALPNAELAARAGLAMEGGVKVDGTLATSAPEVLAIGDVASFPHPSVGSAVRLESVQNATDQGRRAARTIMGRSGVYTDVPWFWSDIGALKLQIAGMTARSDQQVVVGDPRGDAFSVFSFRGDVFTGAECVNRPADFMLARRMLKAGFNPTAATIVAGIEALKDAFSSSHALEV